MLKRYNLNWRSDHDQSTGRLTRVEMYDFVTKNPGGAYVKDSRGEVAYLIPATSIRDNKYVKTVADETKRDNLLSLPECK